MEKSTFVRYTTLEEKKAAFMRSVNLRKEWETKMRKRMQESPSTR